MSEDDNSEEEVDLRKRVEEIYGNTLSPDTKKTYSSYLRVTAEFLSEKHPDQLNEDGTINFEELTIAAFEEFLAEKLVKKRSYSTLSVPLLFLHSVRIRSWTIQLLLLSLGLPLCYPMGLQISKC